MANDLIQHPCLYSCLIKIGNKLGKALPHIVHSVQTKHASDDIHFRAAMLHAGTSRALSVSHGQASARVASHPTGVTQAEPVQAAENLEAPGHELHTSAATATNAGAAPQRNASDRQADHMSPDGPKHAESTGQQGLSGSQQPASKCLRDDEVTNRGGQHVVLMGGKSVPRSLLANACGLS